MHFHNVQLLQVFRCFDFDFLLWFFYFCQYCNYLLLIIHKIYIISFINLWKITLTLTHLWSSLIKLLICLAIWSIFIIHITFFINLLSVIFLFLLHLFVSYSELRYLIYNTLPILSGDVSFGGKWAQPL